AVTTRDPHPGEVHGVDYLFVTRDEFDTFLEAESLIDQSGGTNDEMSGLCLDAVLEIIQAGQVAVFEADYYNLPQIRTAALKPLIVFVKPPSLEVLIETRQVISMSPRPADSNLCSPQSSPVRSVPTTPRLTSANRPNRGFCSSVGRSRPDMRHRSDEQLRVLGSSTGSSSVTDLLSRNKLTEAQLQDMLKTAARMEVTHGHLCDHVLINDDLPVALEQLSELAYRMETEAFWVPRHWVQPTLDVRCLNESNSNVPNIPVDVADK
ncbi:MAGUK p55 subfamily member 7, partial [Fasciolopsis buskii]